VEPAQRIPPTTGRLAPRAVLPGLRLLV